MTNEGAIGLLKSTNTFLRLGYGKESRTVQAIDLAIKALEQQSHRCHNCMNEKYCKVAQRLGTDGFCSEWEGEEQ